MHLYQRTPLLPQARGNSVLGQRLFDLGIVLYIVLIAFFGSSIQDVLPRFSTMARLTLFLAACGVLGFKIAFCTRYDSSLQLYGTVLLLLYCTLIAYHSTVFVFALVWLMILAAKDIPHKRTLDLLIIVQSACVLAVTLLRIAGRIPEGDEIRASQFSYYHYNYYASFLLGIAIALICRKPSDAKITLWECIGLLGLFLYIMLRVTAKGAGFSVLIILVLALLFRWMPSLFKRAEKYLLPLLPSCCILWTLIVLKFYRWENPIWYKVDRLFNGRLELLYNHGQLYEPKLFGGVILFAEMGYLDNTYWRLCLQLGILMLILFWILSTKLFVMLARKKAHRELFCLSAMMLYCLMEAKFFELQANPLLPMLAAVIYNNSNVNPTLPERG